MFVQSVRREVTLFARKARVCVSDAYVYTLYTRNTESIEYIAAINCIVIYVFTVWPVYMLNRCTVESYQGQEVFVPA